MKKREKHGLVYTRLYRIWRNMKCRCNNPNASKYNLYGGKGIKVCNEWESSFKCFYEWAMDNGYRDDLTIDRIDSNKGYNPSNCKWATYKEQNSHLKFKKVNPFKTVIITYKDKSLSLTEWAKEKNINYKTLLARYERGWDIQRMLETPIIKNIKRGENGRWIQN